MTRMLLFFLPLLAPAQEKPSAEDLLKKIDRKDPAASFRAIGELVALPRDRRSAIEAGAEKLEGFYRDALRSELKLRDDLGDLFGKDLRVTLKKKDVPRSLLNDLEAQAGLKILDQGNGARLPSDPVEAEMENVPPLLALADICHRAQLIAYVMPGSPEIVVYSWQNPPKPFGYRNFAFFPASPTKRKRIDFSGPSPWTVTISLNAVTEPGLAVAAWKPQARMIEAVTEKDVKLQAAQPETPGSVRRQSDESSDEEGAGATVSFSLRVAEGAGEKIARARFVATALLARSTREYRLSPAKPKAEDDELEVSLIESKPAEGNFYALSTVVVKPKRLKPAELACLPLRFQSRFKEFGDATQSAGRKVKASALEFQIMSYPKNGIFPQLGGFSATLEEMKLSVPLVMVERPVYVELVDLPLK